MRAAHVDSVIVTNLEVEQRGKLSKSRLGVLVRRGEGGREMGRDEVSSEMMDENKKEKHTTKKRKKEKG